MELEPSAVKTNLVDEALDVSEAAWLLFDRLDIVDDNLGNGAGDADRKYVITRSSGLFVYRLRQCSCG